MAKSESKRCSVVRCRKKGASSFRKVKMFVKVLCISFANNDSAKIGIICQLANLLMNKLAN